MRIRIARSPRRDELLPTMSQDVKRQLEHSSLTGCSGALFLPRRPIFRLADSWLSSMNARVTPFPDVGDG